MPLGSSSLAPVINPGPSRWKKPMNPLRFAMSGVLPTWATSSAGCGPGLTTERMGSGLGSGAAGCFI